MIPEEELLKRRANCRIWFHLLLWFFIPLGGGLISSYKMRFMTPVYIILAGFCFGMTTYQPSSSSQQTELVKVYQHGIQYRFIVNVIGSALAIYQIRKSRRTLSTRNQSLEFSMEMGLAQIPSPMQTKLSLFSNSQEPVSLSKNLVQFPIDSKLQNAQYLWKQARAFASLTSSEKDNS
jgi:hypothetical protein